MKLNQESAWILGDDERLRILSHMRMICAHINLELGHDGITQTVVRHHALDGAMNEKFRAALAHFFGGLHFLIADVSTTLAGVDLLLLFLAGQTHLISIDHHDEVAGINMRCESGARFATNEIGGSHGDLAEDLILGVNDPPLAGHVLGFGRECLHKVL